MPTNACIEAIKNQALVDAACSRYCRNCALSYFRENEERGMCKIPSDAPPTSPVIVEEFYVCEHWTKK